MIEWLLKNAAPVIRYRTLTELIHSEDEVVQDTLAEVLTLPQTQKRLSLLRNFDCKYTHGANSLHLENILPMLNDFGLYYGMEAFCGAAVDVAGIEDKLVGYPFLLRAKFPIGGLIDYAIERIDTIYDFTRHMDFDIYDDVADYKSVPKPFRDRPVIKPSIAIGDKFRIPLIYDIVMFAAVYDDVSAELQTKINNIMEYIIAPEYDIVIPMYGILYASPRRYYAMGWDCKKPFHDNQNYDNQNLHRLLLYANFPTVQKSTWFQNAIGYLMQYKTTDGTFIFPAEYLMEKDCNWVLGTRMSLAENRRKKQWVEIESTFYMQKLLGVNT